jgi:hypothetical protein
MKENRSFFVTYFKDVNHFHLPTELKKNNCIGVMSKWKIKPPLLNKSQLS